MSKKRTSTESSHEEQTTKDSGGELIQAVFQNEEDNTKRAKLNSMSDTTLEDLPMELIECILVKTVATEVKSMKLDKRERKEKADLVVSRLRTVSLQWSSILSTNFFQNELHRTLEAQEILRVEVFLQPAIQAYIVNLTSLRDELFVLFKQEYEIYRGPVLYVYDRTGETDPEPIMIPYFREGHMAACSVSNCVYLLNADGSGLSITRLWKDEDRFYASLWIKNLRLPLSDVDSTGLSVSAQGNLVIFSRQRSPSPTVVGIYDANGLVQHKIRLSPVTYGFSYVSSVIQKANGNLLLTSSDNVSETKLLEIDTSGRIIREYQSSHIGAGVKSFEDIYDRIVVDFSGNRIELLDAEFNFLDAAAPQLDDGEEWGFFQMHYNSDRHEMVGFRSDWDSETSTFAALSFTDE